MNQLPPTPKLRLFAALFVAACFSDLTKRATWRKFKAAFAFGVGLAKDNREQVSLEKYTHRLATCKRCVLYYAPLGTCGSPLVGELSGLGCYCSMDTKSQYVDARCWLDTDVELGHPNGWHYNHAE